MEPIQVNGDDKKLLRRCMQGPVSFTHAIDMTGKVQTKVVRSTIPSRHQKQLHALALKALVSEAVGGCGGHGEPPEHTVTYTITALGRLALGHKAVMPTRTRGSTALSDAELELEGIA